MRFKFTIQPYQTEAVNSVAEVFRGQPFQDRFTYRRDTAAENDLYMPDGELFMGFANSPVKLNNEQLKRNINCIQAGNNIKLDQDITCEAGLGVCSLDVEMETGTGKTYVYIKTMFELNKQYGWSKFIVVVPSIAIREGVRKSFNIMQDHFMEYYNKKARFFVYDSKNLAEIDNFSQSADINVMIINVQAFNARNTRRISAELDDFGSRRPIDIIKANRPIVILDEPQKMGAATREKLRDFAPLFCLNYSATHRDHHTLVYVLDALDAYNKQLVKQIIVKGFEIHNLQGTDGYMYLERIDVFPDKPPEAVIEIEISYSSAIKRKRRKISVDDDLFTLSNNMEQYRGFNVSDIDPSLKTVSFTNGEILNVGDVVGNVAEKEIRRAQIRETIRSHFEKEKALYARGIKCLSLFFIDEVAKYRKYDDDGNEINSEYGEIFEEEYVSILNEYLTGSNTPYKDYISKIKAQDTHAGYFSIDRRGRKINSSLRRNSDESDDISAYDLILKDKERLLSFSNPVRFIFSHSALREGWDNPNVFQICTLKHGGSSAVQKRQEVGRGLRLCVNQNGDRMDVDTLGSQVRDVNQLTVIASDGYKDFVEDLQNGIRADLYERPEKADIEYFTGKTLRLDGNEVTISDTQGRSIYNYLAKYDYVDDEGHITEKYRIDNENNTLAPLPEICAEIGEGVHALIRGIFDPNAVKRIIGDGHGTKISENKLNGNFYKKEFQRLWNLINHKYAYTVEFDSGELIRKAIAHIDAKMFVTQLQYTLESGTLELNSGTVSNASKSNTQTLNRSESSRVKYDLVGKIAEGTKLTRRSAARILEGISPEKFAMFRNNPEDFIVKAIRLINEQKAAMIVEHIEYNRTEGVYDSDIFTAQKNAEYAKAYRSKKNVQDYVFTDGYARNGKSVERQMAENMDIAEEVCVYAKLPKGFSIPTPVGNYSPDWAIVFNKGTVKHIFFIAETKGTMETLNLRPIEQAKIQCAKKLFSELSAEDVVYHEVDSYQTLLNIMESL